MKKQNSSKKLRFLKVLTIPIILITFIAYMDLVYFVPIEADTASIWGISARMATMFWLFAYALIIIVPVMYYLWTKDKSESLALFLTPLILIWTGSEDFIFYLLKGANIFSVDLSYLNNNIMHYIANFMGSSIVTGTSLLVSVCIGVAVVIAIDWILMGWN